MIVSIGHHPHPGTGLVSVVGLFLLAILVFAVGVWLEDQDDSGA